MAQCISDSMPDIIFMNEVKLKFDPFQDKCTIVLNGETLERFSSLNSYVNESILSCAATLLQDVSDELNDEFGLVVVGTDFEKYFLGDLQQLYQDCTSYKTEDFGAKVDLNQRFAQAEALFGQNVPEYKEAIYSQWEISLDQRLAIAVDTPEKADICVAKDLAAAKLLAESCKGQLIIYLAEKAEIHFEGKNKCLWGVKEVLLAKRLQAAVERFAIPRYINVAQSVTKHQTDKTVQASVETLQTIDVAVSVSVAKVAFEDDILKPVFTADGKMPRIRMESINPQVIEIVVDEKDQRLCLKAVGEGTADVRFYKDNGIEPFETVTIQVRANNLLKKITLSAPKELKAGKRYEIGAQYEPWDSPEIGEIVWSVSDPSVICLEKDRSIRALKAGKAVITAKAERVSANVAVEVLPGMEQILLSEEKVKLSIGAKKALTVSVLPAACSGDKIICTSTKPKVAVAQQNEFGQWIVVAKGIEAKGTGDCQLIFTDEDGNCKAVCNVTVESSIKVTERKSAYLTRTAIMTLVAFALQFLPTSWSVYGVIGAGIVAVLMGIVCIIKNPKDSFWTILLMAIAVWIAVGNFMNL